LGVPENKKWKDIDECKAWIRKNVSEEIYQMMSEEGFK